MINTIFYFPLSLSFADYIEQWESGLIADNTIVFANDEKAIYKGGVKYGGFSSTEFHNAIDELYDDSWIKDELDGIKNDILEHNTRINGLNILLGQLNTRLNQEISNLDSTIQVKIENLFKLALWIRDNWPKGVTEWNQGWNEDLEAYLRTVGYWTVDSDGNVITKWSQLQQALQSLTLQVNELIEHGSMSEALSTEIELKITDKIAELSLGTTYAKTEDVDNIHKVIEWLYSGLKTQSSPELTFSLIQSAGKSGLLSAISEVRTYVEKLKSGDYIAEATLTAKVKDSLASLITQASSDNVLAALSAKADFNSDNIAALMLGMTGNSSTADIQTRILNKFAGLISSADLNSAKSEIYSAISAKDNSNNFISLAALKTAVDENTATISLLASNGEGANSTLSGFVTKAGLGLAVAELFASSGDNASPTAKSSVVALVSDNKSLLLLTADDVLVSGSTTVAGKLTALEGLITNSVSTNSLHAYSGDVTNFTGTSNGSHIVIEDGAIDGYKADGTVRTQNMYAFNANGSGYVANGNIAWDADGNVTINSKNVNAGSTYNTFEIYKWIVKPTGFVAYTLEELPYHTYGETGYFQYEMLLGYRITKNGFIVKDDLLHTETVLSSPTKSTLNYTGGPYRSDQGVIGYTVGNPVGMGTNYIFYNVYGYSISSIKTSNALLFLRSIKNDHLSLFDTIFKDDSGSYIFESGDNIYVSFPDNIVRYNPTLVALDQLYGFNYNLIIDQNQNLTDTLLSLSTWDVSSPILWANTDQNDSPYLYLIIMLMLTDLVGATKAAEVYQDLFYYNDDEEEVIKSWLGLGFGVTGSATHTTNLNVNARELYEIWYHRNISTPDYTQTEVDKWNGYKADYIAILNAGTYTKGSLSVVPNSELMYYVSRYDNSPGFTQYSQFADYRISEKLSDVGNPLSPTKTSLISDPEIIVSWSDIMAN